MPRITSIHYKKFEKFLKYVGCEFERQRGDHLVYKRADLIRPIVFSAEPDLPMFIIQNNIKVLGISKEQYIGIIQKL